MGAGTSLIYSEWVNAFLERLREHGWTEGRTVAIEYRWAEGSYEHAADIAAEFVRMKVDVIVTASTPNTLATKKATSEIPIIFASAGDPVGGGLVASLARPGGNDTGLSIQAAETTGKRIELLREALHALSRLAIMGNGNNSAVVVEMRETQAAADKLGLNATTFEIRRSEDIAPAFEKIRGHFDALFVPAEPLANTNRRRISSFALAMHLPTSFGSSEYVEVGGLMLDEATSAIDVATEHKILKRMVDLNPRPTIVMIAHRDQSLAYCDRVLRFENSRFVTDEPPGTV